jgi:hypothetical protein
MIDGHGSTEQRGPRRLAAELAAAYERWRELGSPSRGRFGITITGERQQLWLDRPDHAISPISR